MGGFSCVLIEKFYECNFTCASAWLWCIQLTTWWLPDDGTHGMPKHIEGDFFVHLLCIYSTAFKVGFIFPHYARYTQY